MFLRKRPKLLITQPIPEEAMRILNQHDIEIVVNHTLPLTRYKFLESLKGCDALFCTLNEKIDKEALDEAGQTLKVNRIAFHLRSLKLKNVFF